MDIKGIISVVAGVIFILGFIPYIRAIVKGDKQPVKSTWIIWASLDTLILIGMYAKDVLNGQIVGITIGAWFVVVLAFKYGIPGWTRLDKSCIIGAIIGVIIWQIFKNPTFGIVISASIVFLGSIPTFVSAWHYPYREDKVGWTIFWISCICAVIAIPKWTFEDATQPIVFCSIETIMVLLLYVKFRPSKLDMKRFLLRAVGGFIFWTVMLTPYMIFIVKTSWAQYWKWFGAQLIIVPIIAAFSVSFINWFVGKFLK